MISLIKKLTGISLLLILTNCANVQSPSGGPSDKTAPQLKKSTPQPNTTNFKGKQIVLEFNEDVNTDKLKTALVITPYKEDNFKIKTKKKTVTIIFEKAFESNTTYTLNFREAIQDITEKNSAKDLSIAFSTGPYIDSISCNGTIKDLNTNTPLENITVALYKGSDTTSIKSGKPIYFTKTDKQGSFNFQNIKNGKYNIYAFQDKNNNLHYEEIEKIGFLENIDLTKKASNINVTITALDTKAPEIAFTKPGNEKTEIKFNEGIILTKIKFNDSTTSVPYSISEDAKTISVFNVQNNYDSIPLYLKLTDSTGNAADIKRNIIFDKKAEKTDLLNIKINPADFKLNTGTIEFKMTFNKPIKYFSNNIKININNSITELADTNYKWNPNRTTINIYKKIKPADTIIIETKKNTFISIKGDSLNSQKIIFTSKKEEDYGMIRGVIETKQPNYILEILDEKFKKVSELRNAKQFNFTYLKPGSYNLRVIIDENNNNKWDNGNLKLEKQPEKIIYYKEKIQLRANWEIENIIFKF